MTKEERMERKRRGGGRGANGFLATFSPLFFRVEKLTTRGQIASMTLDFACPVDDFTGSGASILYKAS